MGEPAYDEFGLPLESDPYAAPVSSVGDPSTQGDSFADVIINGQNKMAELWLGLISAGTTLGTGAQGTIGNVADSAAQTIQHGQDVVGGAVEDVTEAANPFNLAGLGIGLSVGSIGTVVGVGLVASFAADQLLFGGSFTASVAKRFTSRRR